MAEPAPKPKALPVVLLVDDEQLLLDTLGEDLKADFKVYTAKSASEAETLLAARRYDVIVCDHMLPGEQGLDFLMRAMEMVPTTRRIMITGYMSPEFISRSTNLAGLSACLLKPIQAPEVAAAINAALS
jgi:response regulator RpfG family c-di-GMP phosphodiesterase